MLYIVGLMGFVGGFLIGQMILFILLRRRSTDDLLDSKKLHWTYGTLNWLIAMAFMAGCLFLYRKWFPAV